MFKTFNSINLTGLAILTICCGCKAADPIHDLDEAAKQFPKDLAAYKSLGLPWTEDQIAGLPKITDDRNAATYLSSADQKLDSILGPNPQSKIEPDDTPFFNSKVLDGWQYANVDFSDVLRLGVLGSQQKNLDYHFAEGVNSIYPSYVSDRRVVLLMCFEAEKASEKQDLNTCCRYLNAAQNCIAMVNQNPDIIAEAIASREEIFLCSSYELCLSNFSHSTDQLRNFKSGFELQEMQYNTDARLKSAMLSQIQTARKYDLTPQELRPDPNSSPNGNIVTNGLNPSQVAEIGEDGIPASDRQKAYLARILEFWTSAYHIVQRKESRVETEKKLNDLALTYNGLQNDSYTMLNLISFSLYPLWFSADSANSKIRAEKQLAAALYFRSTHGAWPTSISQVGNLTPPDSAIPYRLAARSSGITIYTVSNSDPATAASLELGKKPKVNEKVHYSAAYFPPSDLQDRMYPF